MKPPSNVTFIETFRARRVQVAANAKNSKPADNNNRLTTTGNPRMQRPSVYLYTNKDAPGCNVHRLREERGWSLRDLADRCNPPIAHTTVQRLEHNKGFQQDTVERVAAALGVTPQDLWLPPELFEYRMLNRDQKERFAAMVRDIAAAYKTKKSA